MCVLCVTVSGERAGRVDRSTHVGVVRLFDRAIEVFLTYYTWLCTYSSFVNDVHPVQPVIGGMTIV